VAVASFFGLSALWGSGVVLWFSDT